MTTTNHWRSLEQRGSHVTGQSRVRPTSPSSATGRRPKSIASPVPLSSWFLVFATHSGREEDVVVVGSICPCIRPSSPFTDLAVTEPCSSTDVKSFPPRSLQKHANCLEPTWGSMSAAASTAKAVTSARIARVSVYSQASKIRTKIFASLCVGCGSNVRLYSLQVDLGT